MGQVLLGKQRLRAEQSTQELLPSEGWTWRSPNVSDHREPIWTRPYPHSFWGYITRNPRPDSIVRAWLYSSSICLRASFLVFPATWVQSYSIASTLIFGRAPTIIQVQFPLLTVLSPFLYVCIRNISEIFICLHVATKLMNGPEEFLSTLFPMRSSTITNHGFKVLPAVLIRSCASYMFWSSSRFTSLKQLFYSNALYFFLHISTISYCAGSCLYVLLNKTIRLGDTFFYYINSFMKRVHWYVFP